MARSAEKLSERNLTERLPTSPRRDEIDQLAHAFNRTFDRLQKAFENQRRFVSDASHELRTPLTVLRAQLEVTLRQERPLEEYRQILSLALAHSGRLSQLVENLLVLARADSGQWHPNFKLTRIDTLCLELVQELRPLAQRKHIALESCCQVPLTVQGNSELLRSLIMNLLDNALQYTPEGGTVRLVASNEDQQAQLTFADTGIGIPANELPSIFERFYRADPSRSGRVRGVGLGLSIVREVVHLHQGSIQVKSTPGQGSVFTVSLPLADSKDSPA